MRIEATLSVSPSNYEGPAPAAIKFNGTITVSGLTADTEIEYNFKRSDGLYTKPRKRKVNKPGGTFNVMTTWMITQAEYTGWKAINIRAPQKMESNHASFSVINWLPYLGVSAYDVMVAPAECIVRFAAVITNYGKVDVSGPIKVIIGAGLENGLVYQYRTWIPRSVVIPVGGSHVTDHIAEIPLVPRRNYWVDILLDPDRRIKRMIRTNDRLQTTWVGVAAPGCEER